MRPPTFSGIVTFDMVLKRRSVSRSTGPRTSSTEENATTSPASTRSSSAGKLSRADSRSGAAGIPGRAHWCVNSKSFADASS